MGLIAPKIAALALAFVPLPHWVPSWTVRLFWLALALGVPITMGLVMGARRPAHAPVESYVKRVARGFPITLGLAIAFLLMFVSVPLMKLAALARRRKSADVPLVTDVAAYHEVARRVVEALTRHGFALQATEASWWVKAPTRVLAWFGGAAFSAFVPARIEHYASDDLELSFYTSGALVEGRGARLSLAQGLIAETAVHSDALETLSAPAQKLEREIQRLWRVFDEAPHDHVASRRLLTRHAEITADLGRADVDYVEWSVLYRQLLQVERALQGKRQLLDEVATQEPEAPMSEKTTEKTIEKTTDAEPHYGKTVAASPPHAHGAPADLSTPDLVKEIAHQVQRLVTAQLTLAKAELRADLTREKKMASHLGVAAVALLATVNLLLVAGVFALASVLPAWAAALCAAGATLLVAAILGSIGWKSRVRRPLARTRDALDQDVKWTKEKMA